MQKQKWLVVWVLQIDKRLAEMNGLEKYRAANFAWSQMRAEQKRKERAEQEQLRGEQKRRDCPIGITPKAHNICSAGTCCVCVMDRNLRYSQELLGKSMQAERDLRAEIEKLREADAVVYGSLQMVRADLVAARAENERLRADLEASQESEDETSQRLAEADSLNLTLKAELAAERERWEQGIRRELSPELAEEVIAAIRKEL